MKLKLIILFLVFLSSFKCEATHITLDQQKVFSELDKLSKDLESDEIWALYIRKFGHEKVMLRFPKSPKLTVLPDDEKSYCIQCKDENGAYKLYVQPINQKNNNVIKENLKKIEQALESEKINHLVKKQSKDVLDVSYDDNETNTHVSQKIIVTKENIFTLVAKHAKSSSFFDKYFMLSFNILNS